jgi:hypothetical protein
LNLEMITMRISMMSRMLLTALASASMMGVVHAAGRDSG